MVACPPVRIVSLLPSATEILFAVGAGADVVGVTFECDFPPEARQRRIVSNTTLPEGLTPAQIDGAVRARLEAGEDLYTLDEGALRAIDPDLVVTQDLCAVCAVDISEVDQALEHLGCRADVLTLDPMTLDEVITSIETVGRATATEERACALVMTLRRRLDAPRRRGGGATPSPDGATRMDRPSVLRRPLGARHGDGSRRRGRCWERAARDPSRSSGRPWPPRNPM